jgi:hypothetical protein
MLVKVWPKGSLPPVHLKLFQMHRERKKQEFKKRFSLTNRFKRSIINKESNAESY